MTPRWPTVALLIALVGALGFVFRRVHETTSIQLAPPSPSASTSASAAPESSVSPDAGAPTSPAPNSNDELKQIAEGTTPPPNLPASAPDRVRFGAILFSYKGAQLASHDARAKDVAKQLAESLLEPSKQDFAEAVKRGDRGSTSDAGQMPRGILEPNLEYLLFTLPRKSVFEHPVDTPRGYLIIKRL